LPVASCQNQNCQNPQGMGRQFFFPVTLVVGGWFRGQKRTKVGFFFRDLFFIVFFTSPHRETPKNVIKKVLELEAVGFGFWAEFL
jgi:hypothetical protein